MKTMSSRERVRCAINFQEADRVPLDIGGSKVTGVCIDAYVKLTEYLKLNQAMPIVYEQFQMLARMEEPVRKRLGCDIIELENPSETWGLENRDWKPWITGIGNRVLMPGNFAPITDEKGYIYILDSNKKPLAYMPKGGLYFERACVTTMSDEIKKMNPEVWKRSIALYTNEHLRILEQNARYLYENTEYSIHGGFLRGGLGTNGIFAGHTITDWLCVLLTDRDYAFSILQATAERVVENLVLYLQAVGKYIDTILISGTDYGTQTVPLFNPEIFRELHVPNMKIINDYIHKHSNAKTMYHSCGAVFDLMEYFIAAGVDIINPIQTTAAKMNPQRLKEKFGGKIVFWGGGIDTQTVMPNGTVEDVRNQVRDRIGIFAPGGGFVFAACHNIQHYVPPANIVAMADAVAESGNYLIVN
jgi:uroporphyrinogen decarboxylase